MAAEAIPLGARPVADAAPARRPTAGIWTNALARLRRDRLTLVAASILLAMILLAAAADVLANNLFQYGFTRQDLLNNYQKPTLGQPAFWLGSDDLGRSEIVRLLYGRSEEHTSELQS